MSPENQPTNVVDDVIVTLEYTLTVDGEVVDSSEGEGPIQFIQGKGQVVEGLEQALYGMHVGERKELVVPPAGGYGEPDSNAIADIPKSEFPDEIPLQPGIELQLTNQEGDELEAFIVSVGKDTVRLDFNHPLAGKELHFAVQVSGLRHATPEELDHGHVHHDDHAH